MKLTLIEILSILGILALIAFLALNASGQTPKPTPCPVETAVTDFQGRYHFEVPTRCPCTTPTQSM